MNLSLINEIVRTIQLEMWDTEELRSLSFYEGAFYVFADQQKKGRQDRQLLHSYLSDFLNDLEGRKEILEKHNPQLLSALEEMLSETSKAGV
jgi:hypothetical protein